jgi:hypothetical protein
VGKESKEYYLQKTLLKVIILLFLIRIGLDFISRSNSISLGLDFYNITFDVDADELNLCDFIIQYDFNSQVGTINFKACGGKMPDSIQISLSELLNVTDYKIFNTTHIFELEKDYKIGYGKPDKFNDLVFYIKKDLKEVNFFANFTIKNKTQIIEPNGRFFFTTTAKTVQFKRDAMGMYDTPVIIKFNLGKYFCNPICYFEVYDKNKVDPQIIYSKNIFRLSVPFETLQLPIEEQPRGTRFVLSTYNSETKSQKDSYWAIGLGLILAFIPLLIEILFKFIDERIKFISLHQP